MITPDVSALRDRCHLPGTRVLQFAFDGQRDNPHLPENYPTNTAVYTGTHDNPTTLEWYEELSDVERRALWSYVHRPGGASAEAPSELMHLAWSSMAALAVAPLQDLLNLGREGRMNVPGHAAGNWSWRVTEELLSSAAFEWLRDLTGATRRSEPWPGPTMAARPDTTR